MQLLSDRPLTGASAGVIAGGFARFSQSFRGQGADLTLYFAVYLALEWASQFHSFAFPGIALWNPSPAASLVLLLTRGLGYAPLLFMAALASSVFVHGTPYGFAGTVASSALLAAGYTGLAAGLKRAGFQLGRGAMQDVGALLIAVPLGALAAALLAFGALFLGGDMARDQLRTAITHSWVGDTLGIVIVIPAVTAVLIAKRRSAEQSRRAIGIDLAVFAAGLGLALWTMFGLAGTSDHQFFYLLFLPVIWVAVRDGFAGAALALLVTQLALLTVTQLVDYDAAAFVGLQMLMLTLAATGLLLGASVTERRLSEERGRIQQAELARMARNTTAGAMGVAIAHQISQPLSTVATHLHVARREASGLAGPPDAMVESLSTATAEMRRAQDMLGRLRDFISHGRSEAVPVDLPALITHLAGVLQAEAAARGVRLSFDLAAVPPISGDAIQIEQVLLNLATNAVEAAAEHAGPRGRVLVRTAVHGDGVRLIVEDNGAGIDPEIASRLYEPFTSTKDTGMGLGLALSRQIVAHHSGRLWWEKAAPSGTQFLAEFPAMKV